MVDYLLAAGAVAGVLDFFRRWFVTWRPGTPWRTALDGLVFGSCWILGGHDVLQGILPPLAWPLAVLYARTEAWGPPDPRDDHRWAPGDSSTRGHLSYFLFLYLTCWPLIGDYVVGRFGTGGKVMVVAICAIGFWVHRKPLVWVYARVLDSEPRLYGPRPLHPV